MSYSLGQPPGATVGPYTVDDGQLPAFQRLTMSWGAWPDPEHPEVLYTGGGRGVTMSTSQALVSLKYQVVAAGVVSLAVGILSGAWFARRRT
jgi:hypothetical protein